MSHPSLMRVYLTNARCDISLGAECTVEYPGSHDFGSFFECSIYDKQKAVVVGLNESSVDIELKTGMYIGRIVKNVDPRHLVFSGIFEHDAIAEEALY
ncbi:MAG: hypothetical protein AAB628_01605 [Patescibacteria group bacterium]